MRPTAQRRPAARWLPGGQPRPPARRWRPHSCPGRERRTALRSMRTALTPAAAGSPSQRTLLLPMPALAQRTAAHDLHTTLKSPSEPLTCHVLCHTNLVFASDSIMNLNSGQTFIFAFIQCGRQDIPELACYQNTKISSAGAYRLSGRSEWRRPGRRQS